MAAISSQLNLDASAQRFKRKALGKTAGVSCRHLNASGRKMHKMMCAALEDSRPEWVRDLEEDAPFDEGAAKVLKGANGDPRKIRENIQREQNSKLAEIMSVNRGTGDPMGVFFRDVDPFNLWIWMEFYDNPSESDKELITAALDAWFAVGKLGGYNGMNLQLVRNADDDISFFDYDTETLEESNMGAFFHEMGPLEFKGEWARFRLDLGTADELGLDCLINLLIGVNEEHFAIKTMFVGGENQDWELPKDSGESLEVPENPMDFAAYARARGFDTSNLKAGDSMKVGDMGYTVEDITKSD